MDTTYFVTWVEASPLMLRDTPLGIYPGRSPDAAARAAAREWRIPAEVLTATPIAPAPATPTPR
jgi:hypothetical protein